MNPIQNRVTKLINNIAQDFSIDKLSKSPARFDLQKLTWFNRQYIQMMSLDEFVTRAFELKSDFLIKKELDSDMKKKIELYHVDLESQKACFKSESLSQKNLIYLTSYIDGDQICEIYIDTQTLDSQLNLVDLVDVLSNNNFITYPTWKQFCKKNNLKLVEPNETILRQYLAWQLDKNRVNLLTEIGTESSCITDWVCPSVDDIKWKKISTQESLINLAEIKNIIENLYKHPELDIKSKQEELYNKVKNEIYFEIARDTEIGLSGLASFWEQILKQWIAENDKDAGSYFWPLRVALSGKAKSPSPFEILAILSSKEVSSRLQNLL